MFRQVRLDFIGIYNFLFLGHILSSSSDIEFLFQQSYFSTYRIFLFLYYHTAIQYNLFLLKIFYDFFFFFYYRLFWFLWIFPLLVNSPLLFFIWRLSFHQVLSDTHLCVLIFWLVVFIKLSLFCPNFTRVFC